MSKTIIFQNPNILLSPRKLRQAVQPYMGMNLKKALEHAKLTNNKTGRILTKSIKNILADAKHNHNMEPSTLKFDQILCNEGLKYKRMDKSHGSRFNRGMILKRHSKLYIKVVGDELLKASKPEVVAEKKVKAVKAK